MGYGIWKLILDAAAFGVGAEHLQMMHQGADGIDGLRPGEAIAKHEIDVEEVFSL